MTFSSFTTARTTNALQSQQLIANLQRDQLQLAKLQQQVSSGSRLQLPSDDPVAAVQIFSLRSTLNRQATFQKNIDTNQGFLSVTDQALGTVNDALNQAKSIALGGVGDQFSDSERTAFADQIASLIQSVTNAGNTQYNGRYLFGGSFGTAPPFDNLGGAVRYNGDGQSLQTFADYQFRVPNNLDGQSAFAGLTRPVQTRDLNPAVSLSTQLKSLHGGDGIVTGALEITVVNGGPPITQSVDLTGAATLQDVKSRIETAFAAASITVSVTIDAGTQSGLRLTPSAGTIAIQDSQGSQVASDLGITSAAAASITGADLDPQITVFSTISALNGGTGIGATAGTGLRIVNGQRTSIVDLDGAATVQDVLNRIRAADPDVTAEISADGRGLAISSRLSGVNFSIGENGGVNATNLGLRTLNASTPLVQLNHGTGAALTEESQLTVQRRDGNSVTIDLSGSATIQNVLDQINAVDPGHLVASLNSVGNGISLTDDSGAGALTVADNELSRRLGIAGSNAGGAAGVLIGVDVNPQQTSGALNILTQLEAALRTGDRRTIGRLLPQVDAEVSRVAALRGFIGARQQLLNTVQNQLGETELSNKATLSKLADTDLPAVISELLQKQQTMQATLQVAAQVNQLSLLDYL